MEGLDARALRSGPVDALADGFAEMIRRFVRFAAAHPERNQIMVHEATAQSGRLRWMTERHVRPLYDTVRALWRRPPGADPDAPRPAIRPFAGRRAGAERAKRRGSSEDVRPSAGPHQVLIVRTPR